MSNIVLQQRALRQPLTHYADLASDTLARVLSSRDVAADQMQLQLKNLLPPTLKGLQTAIELIDAAIDAGQKILIVGDYDADGATSTALMMLALTEMGAKVAYLVPDRFKYGYGLTPAIAELAATQHQPDLLITVDNGISSHAGVARSQQLGMQVIVTDHHLTTKATPDAQAVVNPNQLGCSFASKSLAGVGVAFYLLASLASRRKALAKASSQLTHYLDLVALGTVADVAKLDFNNRILVQAGLKRIRQRQCRPGILALLAVAQKDPSQIQAQDFGFVLGPRINAAGRMDSMRIGIECLLAEDLQRAFGFAYQLEQLNQQRRQVEASMREQAFEAMAELKLDGAQLPAAIVLYQPEWHQGVIGIIAGRLKEHFHRPSIVFALDEDGEHLKGSARSIAGIHIRDCIEAVAQDDPHLVKFFGGHAAAAGLTLKKQHFAEFQQQFIAQMQGFHADLFAEKIYTDGALAEHEFSLDFLQQIQALEPWGQGFELPVFEGIFQVFDYQWLKEQHLKLKLKLAAGQIVEAIAFSYRDKLSSSVIADQVRLAYQLDANEFRGERRLQLRIVYLENL